MRRLLLSAGIGLFVAGLLTVAVAQVGQVQWPPVRPATPTWIQGWVTRNGTTSSSTVVVTVAPSAGHALVVFAIRIGQGVVTSVTDNASNTYTAVDNEGTSTNCGAGLCMATFINCSISSAPTTITVNMGVTSEFQAAYIEEVSGIATTSCVDSHSALYTAGPAASANTIKSGDLTASTTGEMVIGGSVNGVGSADQSVGTSPLAYVAGQYTPNAVRTEHALDSGSGTLTGGTTFTPATTGQDFADAGMVLKHQ